MHAIILAAGVGKRLNTAHETAKCLLEFGGKTLLERHCDALVAVGVDQLTLCLGYRTEAIIEALQRVSLPSVVVHYNPLYTLGSVVSLWTARQALLSGDDVLIMDADVLYHPAIVQRLVASPSGNCFLLDRDFEAGDEPVKICLDGARIVEFRKHIAPAVSYNRIGESVGFFKFDAATAGRLVNILAAYVSCEKRELPHEEALRDLALSANVQIDVEDISGLPWIEIDFPQDISRARQEILPALDIPAQPEL